MTSRHQPATPHLQKFHIKESKLFGMCICFLIASASVFMGIVWTQERRFYTGSGSFQKFPHHSSGDNRRLHCSFMRVHKPLS